MFDYFLFLLTLPVSLVYFIVFLVLIPIIDHYNPIFLQERVGKNGKKFICIKFQKLKPPKTEDEINNKELDKLRSTKLGDYMNDHGIDEIPQFINVLKGDMAFIGPRPLLVKHIKQLKDINPEIISRMRKWEKLRSQVKPGITGWHQIHMDGAESRKIVPYDFDYFKKRSVKTSIEIFTRTILILFLGKKRYFSKTEIF
jgi:lipopolysaccharide/colanic/teichoic acid biosynthesis glycosyltransferase